MGGADARHTKGGVSKSRLASAWRCRAWRLASTSSGGASPPSPALRASSPRRTRNAAFAAHEITRKGSGGLEGLGGLEGSGSSEGLEVSGGSDVVERGEGGGDEGLRGHAGIRFRRDGRVVRLGFHPYAVTAAVFAWGDAAHTLEYLREVALVIEAAVKGYLLDSRRCLRQELSGVVDADRQDVLSG